MKNYCSFFRLLPLLVLLLVVGCSDSKNSQSRLEPSAADQSPNQKSTKPVLITGDLPALKKQGELRLLISEFEASSQDLSQASAGDYQNLAEAFALSLGLKPVWVYGTGPADLMAKLKRGEGDLIVNYLTKTAKREQEVGFSLAIDTVDEVLLYNTKQAEPDLQQDSFKLAAIEGTSFLETAEALALKNEKIELIKLPENTAYISVLDGIENGEYQASILDKRIAQPLIAHWPRLAIGQTIEKERLVGWVVRKNALELKRELNHYLLSHSILSSYQDEFRSFQTIKKKKLLRVITMNTPTSYFLWQGQVRGFDYEMIKSFAKKQGLNLRFVLRDSPEQMIAALKQGQGDVIAASLTVDDSRSDLLFSKPYLQVTEQLVAMNKPGVADINDLAQQTITVNPHASFYHSLKNYNARSFTIDTREGVRAAALLQEVIDGELDYTVADSHLVSMEQAYNPELKVVYDFNNQRDIALALRPEQEKLKAKLDQFITKYYKSLDYNVRYKRYFVSGLYAPSIAGEGFQRTSPISSYDGLFEQYAAKYNFDWRLIAAQSYQESRFNPKAKSFAGARGLMQVMPRTARSLGFDDMYDPEQNVAAALQFMSWLQQRFPRSLTIDEKVYFILAAYNAGHGHVHDARILARQLGKDPNQWFGHVDQAMLLLSRPEYYQRARYGYVRGREPVKYVKEIRDRYLAYVNVTD
jgi:membrane-bound lytic murein transglycosylase F